MELTIPADFKLTYGPLFPGAKGAWAGGVDGVLRIYEGTKQRGIIRDVQTFMDKRITVTNSVASTTADKSLEEARQIWKRERKALMDQAKKALAEANTYRDELVRAQTMAALRNPDADPTQELEEEKVW